jgi:hypothetical protein
MAWTPVHYRHRLLHSCSIDGWMSRRGFGPTRTLLDWCGDSQKWIVVGHVDRVMADATRGYGSAGRAKSLVCLVGVPRVGRDGPCRGAGRPVAALTGPAVLISPMLATLGTLPTGPGWAYEFKWDGVRAITYLQSGGQWVYTRNDRNVTATYPELPN